MRPSKAYGGLLREPIRVSEFGERGISERLVGTMERLDALLKHYEILKESPGMWFELALAMADDLVPGFRVEYPKPGAMHSKKAVDDLVLFVELYKVEESGGSVKNAARHLAKRGNFKGRSPEGLRQRYYLLKRGGEESRRMVYLLNLLK